MTQQPHIFISYQRADGDIAQTVREHLVAHGLRTWMDRYDIPVGAYWPDEIDKGLAGTDIVVGVLSANAVESRNVKNEWDWAIANERPLILFQIAPCVIPHRYVSINYIDATRDTDSALQQLTAVLGGRGSIVTLPLAGTSVPVHTRSRIVTPNVVAPVADSPQADPFVGRERELAGMITMLDSALEGQGQLLLLAGEPGIGKTRLAEELATLAAARGARVFWGRCFEWEGAPAFWPWVELLRAYIETTDPAEVRSQLGGGAPFVAQIVPDLASVLASAPQLPPMNAEQARFRLFDAVARFLQSAAARRPLMLVLDDLHWADEGSLLLLELVARELRRVPLLMVATYRDIEVRRDHPLAHTLASMARSVEPRRVKLEGISRPSVGEYITVTTGVEPSEQLVEIIHDGTEGNPFFVVEVVRLLASEGQLDRDAGEETIRLRVPESVREVVERRLSQLGELSNELLSIAAVIGRDFSLRVLQQVSGCDADEVLDALEDCIEARLVDELAGIGQYRFSHALVRETLYAKLRTTRRVRLHGQVGETLERAYVAELAAHASELAHHFAAATTAGYTSQAMTYATLAAERALAQFAWETAIQHYQLALQLQEQLEQPEPSQQIELLLQLGEAQNRIAAGRQRTGMMALGAGGSPSGLTTFRRAAVLARAAGTPEQLARAALGVAGFNPFPQQGGTDGLRLLEQALDRLPPVDNPLRVRLLARLGVDTYMQAVNQNNLTLTDDLATRIRSHSSSAITMARQLADPASLAYALAMRALQDRLQSPEDRLADAEEAVEAGSVGGDLITVAWALRSKHQAESALGDIMAVRATLEQLARVADEIHLPYFQWKVACARADDAMLAGRLSDAEQFLDQADAIQPVSKAGNSQRAALYRELDRAVDARVVIEQIDTKHQITTHLYWLRTRLDSGTDDSSLDSLGLLRSTLNPAGRQDYGLRALALLAELINAVSSTTHAQALYDVLTPFAGENVPQDSSDSGGCASYYLGLLATTLERWDEAEQHFVTALERNERWGFRLYVVHTLAGWADMLARRMQPGDRYHALELLDRTQSLATEIGAVRLKRLATTQRATLMQHQPGH